MKKILIIYPHFPPSNLVGVHRIRLFAQHLPSFDWEPVILTVHEDYYEENKDYDLVKLLPPQLRIVKANAFSITKPRLIGDIGLRAFWQLYQKGKQLLQNEKFDFLLCSIPSFYCALLGRLLHSTTGIRYGIDYQDPWVHKFPGSNKFFSRHWLSTNIAKILEPVAIKNTSLITGIAESYYNAVIKRNPGLQKIITGAMPMGGEMKDYEILASLQIKPYLFKKKLNKFLFVYAGAMLPKAYLPLEKIFQAIVDNKNAYEQVEFHFIGTGKKPNDSTCFSIKPLAEKFGLYNSIVFEYPARIPYLDVLVHLNIADGVFILGSTEAHYTPSKVYQAILAAKPILAVLHQESSAVKNIEDSHAGIVLSYNGESNVTRINEYFTNVCISFFEFSKSYNNSQIDNNLFQEFSAYAVTKKLAILLDKTMDFK